MLEKIRAYIKENGMLKRKDKIVAGISGVSGLSLSFLCAFRALKGIRAGAFCCSCKPRHPGSGGL